MSAHQPTIHNPNQQARDDQRKEEGRREELEKRRVEEEIHGCDAHDFYDQLARWLDIPIPPPVYSHQHIFIFKKNQASFQPIPVTRLQFRFLYSLSNRTGQILKLLRVAEQKGFECPYIHQVNKEILESAIQKCDALQKAIVRFRSTSGMVSRLLHLLQGSYVQVLAREVERFRNRLEAIFLLSRQAEFTQDLVKLRRAVTYRTGYVLGPESEPIRPLGIVRKKGL